MRKEIPRKMDTNILRETMESLGYTIVYYSDTEVEGKYRGEGEYRGIHFGIRTKKRRTYISGHIDTGIIHKRRYAIVNSKELEDEVKKILDRYFQIEKGTQ